MRTVDKDGGGGKFDINACCLTRADIKAQLFGIAYSFSVNEQLSRKRGDPDLELDVLFGAYRIFKFIFKGLIRLELYRKLVGF